MMDAIAFRNQRWRMCNVAPPWVDLETVGLDRFFTRPEVAAACHADMAAFLKRKAPRKSFHFIEPSAGAGAFLDLLPPDRRTGLDVAPTRPEILKHDFLTWTPPKVDRRSIAVIGNPPFGYRAWLALAFVNHAATFADHIGMILPMAFQSDGKGSPKHRVEGMALQSSSLLPPDSFVDATGRPAKVNALWQIWSRGENKSRHMPSCDDYVDLFTVDQRKERLCGQDKMGAADYFLQRTFYRDPPSLVKSFSEVRYVCGYGFIVKQKKREIREYLDTVDWRRYSNLAAHNCRHISMYHIKHALADGGYANAVPASGEVQNG